MNYKQQLAAFSGLFGLLGLGVTSYKSAVYYVEPGHRSFKFNKVLGVREQIYREGWHLKAPWFERAIIYDVRTHPRVIKSVTGSKDLQMVNLSLRVLFRPDATRLPSVYRYLGSDYDGRVLPSVVNEVLKSVVARYNASQLLTQREQVSAKIRESLNIRLRDFFIVLDDVSITDLHFGPEFSRAIEEKQIAQQQAERAKFQVEQAIQDKKSTIIRAKGEAQAAVLLGQAMSRSPAFLELRRLEAAREIATVMSKSRNRVYLDSDTLLLNLTQGLD